MRGKALFYGVADTVFEAVTGKDLRSTVMALFTGDKKTAVASTPVAPAVYGAVPASKEPEDVGALMSALSNKGVDPEMARRATFAYSRTMAMAEAAALR